MRKIILSIVALLLICCFIFIAIKSDGFTNFDKVFDSVYDQVNKYVKPTADTAETTNKFYLYNENRELTNNANYISYLHKYSEDFKDSTSDSMYYFHINANLTNNYEFIPFRISFGNSDNMCELYFKQNNNMGVTAEFTYYNVEEYMSGTEFPVFEEELIYITSQYDFYFVFGNEKITICYYSTDFPPIEEEKVMQALKFPIFVFEKNNAETKDVYEFIYDIFDNRVNPFSYSFYIDSLSGNISNELITTEYYTSLTEIDMPQKEGYTFKGFYYDAEFTKPYTGIPAKPFEELYQKWEINTYRVIFDCRTEEDPNLDLLEITYNYGSVIDYVPFEREGYDFLGWYDDITGADYNNEKITQDMYLRAKWSVQHFMITYIDIDLDVLYKQRVEIGGYATYIPKKVGYKFVGWENFDTSLPIMEDITLKAEWMPAECTITLFINNNVYKAYKVGYGQSLEDFLSDIGIKEKYISRYEYSDLTGSQIPINEINLEKDMRIDVSESYLKNKELIESVNANKSLIVIGASALIGLIILSIIISIFSGKKHKKKR